MATSVLLLLDLDGTLLDHDGSERAAITSWLDDEGWPTDVGGVSVADAWHDITEQAFDDHRRGLLSFQGQRRQRVSRLLALVVGGDGPDDATADALFERYRARYEAAWHPFPDVADTIPALAQRHRVAVLSNGELAEKRAKVARIGVSAQVEAVLASSDLGAAKPDPRTFLRAAARLGVAPEDVVHVGDRLDLDARAPQAVGMRGVWLDRPGLGPDPDDVTRITSLRDLPGLLASGWTGAGGSGQASGRSGGVRS